MIKVALQTALILVLVPLASLLFVLLIDVVNVVASDFIARFLNG